MDKVANRHNDITNTWNYTRMENEEDLEAVANHVFQLAQGIEHLSPEMRKLCARCFDCSYNADFDIPNWQCPGQVELCTIKSLISEYNNYLWWLILVEISDSSHGCVLRST